MTRAGEPAGAPRAGELRARLRDGGEVVLRPIRPEDAGALAAAFERLSAASRQRRFLAPVPELRPDVLRYLTDVDQRDHLAWIAFDPAAPGRPGVGVARAIRLPGEPTVAEAAVTVVDAYQGRGLGTLLLGALGAAARAQGITTFRALVDAHNAPMLALLRELGAEVRGREEGAWWFDVGAPGDPASLPDTPAGRVVRAVAAGQVQVAPPGG